MFPAVREVAPTELDAMLGNIVAGVCGAAAPYFIACRTTRRGVRRDGRRVNSPRRKPLFLHLLLVTRDAPGYAPSRVWLDGIELQLEGGWAVNDEFCDQGVSLVYCEALPGPVPPEVMARCWDFGGTPPRHAAGVYSHLYLRLEWRKWAFARIPEVRVQ